MLLWEVWRAQQQPPRYPSESALTARAASKAKVVLLPALVFVLLFDAFRFGASSLATFVRHRRTRPHGAAAAWRQMDDGNLAVHRGIAQSPSKIVGLQLCLECNNASGSKTMLVDGRSLGFQVACNGYGLRVPPGPLRLVTKGVPEQRVDRDTVEKYLSKIDRLRSTRCVAPSTRGRVNINDTFPFDVAFVAFVSAGDTVEVCGVFDHTPPPHELAYRDGGVETLRATKPVLVRVVEVPATPAGQQCAGADSRSDGLHG